MVNVEGLRNWLCDMDGVLINDGAMVPGADLFLDRLRRTGRRFLVLTNNSLFTPLEVAEQLGSMGLDVDVASIWTSALATAQFVATQRPGGSAFVIGKDSVHQALSDVGYREDPHLPDYVVLGETWEYSFDDFALAVRAIKGGSHFVATNPEPTGPTTDGSLPGCGAMAALIENATGVAPFFVGKPNSLMIREAMGMLHAPTQSSVMIGDRMETDILAGVDAGLTTILVLSGANVEGDALRYPFRPSRVVPSVADLVGEL
ncbi:MAG: HAD family hydrolase [Acidobacteriota bacterium]|nr:HAD family hydrolase [Acidobacteriota bacterium]MDE3093700.1 HAD family hydrolase [Acidobacteriota bacterium]MDE3146044.1 HAD family hydrolase [Acidobacteriota bacterium]